MSHIDLIDRRRRAARLRIAELIALRKALRRRDAEPKVSGGGRG